MKFRIVCEIQPLQKGNILRDHFYKRGVYCDISRASPHIWVFFLVKIYPRQERFILLGHFYKEVYIGTLSASPHIRVLQKSDLTKRSVGGLPLQVSFYRRGRILLNSLLHRSSQQRL